MLQSSTLATTPQEIPIIIILVREKFFLTFQNWSFEWLAMSCSNMASQWKSLTFLNETNLTKEQNFLTLNPSLNKLWYKWPGMVLFIRNLKFIFQE